MGNEKARYIYGNQTTGLRQVPGYLQVNANNEIVVGADNCQGCGGNTVPVWQSWIFNVDTSGQISNEYFTPIGKNIASPFKVTQTPDGGTVFSAVKIHNYPQPNGSINYRYQGSVTKLNSQLELEWDSIYGIESLSTNLAHVVPDRSGGYVAVGTHSNPNHPRVGWMTKLNAQGEMQWQRFFLPFPSLQDPQWGYLEHVAVTEFGNIVAAGKGQNLTGALDHAQYAWIIKTDSMGCLVPGCAVSLRELTTEPVYLKAWPNPVSEVLNVLVKSEQPLHGTQFKLIDMVGRTQRQWEGSYEELQYQIAVRDLPAGLYVLQLVKGGQLLAREKVVVTH
ncbi:MAG: T9SS type A sorting domain-containing protein [Bacteroidia bacterium]